MVDKKKTFEKFPAEIPEQERKEQKRSSEYPSASQEHSLDTDHKKIQAVPAEQESRPHSPEKQKTLKQREIENILADGLGDLYRMLPDASSQNTFRRMGEELAREIEILAESRPEAKQAREVLHTLENTIDRWLNMLKVIPDINEAYLANLRLNKTHTLMKKYFPQFLE